MCFYWLLKIKNWKQLFACFQFPSQIEFWKQFLFFARFELPNKFFSFKNRKLFLKTENKGKKQLPNIPLVFSIYFSIWVTKCILQVYKEVPKKWILLDIRNCKGKKLLLLPPSHFFYPLFHFEMSQNIVLFLKIKVINLLMFLLYPY